ncbi:MAG: four helix bundle protein [bacterium]
MTETRNSKHYDLEDRTLEFAKAIRAFVKLIPKELMNIDDCKQLLRSSGSVGANYIEANEALSKKDFIVRIKICRKESKESRYWLRVLAMCNTYELEKERKQLEQESHELMNIFGAILQKSK